MESIQANFRQKKEIDANLSLHQIFFTEVRQPKEVNLMANKTPTTRRLNNTQGALITYASINPSRRL